MLFPGHLLKRQTEEIELCEAKEIWSTLDNQPFLIMVPHSFLTVRDFFLAELLTRLGSDRVIVVYQVRWNIFVPLSISSP